MRLAIVQFGDFSEAFERFRNGGGETYYAQKYSVDYVVQLAEKLEFVGVCAVLGETPYEKPLLPSLTAACVPLDDGRVDEDEICRTLERWRPTHLVLQTPASGLIEWGLKRRIEILPVLADSWLRRGPRSWFTALRLSRLVNNPAIRAVGNHNIPACLSLKAIGVDPEKIYPWDWPHELTPDLYPPKALLKGPASVVFVGAMTEQKGSLDCIKAAALLRDARVDFRMTLVGSGTCENFARMMVSDLGLDDLVKVAGRLPHDEVVETLAGAALSLVPSHHAYGEGLPMTIYESLAVRTPLILSDHPMFRKFFASTPAARMVPEKSPGGIAGAVRAALADPAGYAESSIATAELWRTIKCDLVWGDLLSAWLTAPDRLPVALAGASLAARLHA